MWLVTIIVLALAAFFTMKVLKSQDLRKAAEKEREMQRSGLEGHLGASVSTPAASLPSDTAESGHATHISSTETSGTSPQAARSSANAAKASGSDMNPPGAGAGARSGSSALSASPLLNSGDPMSDIREMIKILNLAEPDAGRLAVSREEFNALRHGDDGTTPSAESLKAVADRLREMLA